MLFFRPGYSPSSSPPKTQFGEVCQLQPICAPPVNPVVSMVDEPSRAKLAAPSGSRDHEPVGVCVSFDRPNAAPALPPM